MNDKRIMAGAALALMVLGGGAAVAAQGGDRAGSGTTPVLLRQDAGGGVPVGDSEGEVRGTANSKSLDEVSEIAGAFLEAHGRSVASEVDGKIVVDDEAQALGDAVMAIEAVPVHDEAGKVVGRFGARFIEERDYEATKAAAEHLVLEVTGHPYAPAA